MKPYSKNNLTQNKLSGKVFTADAITKTELKANHNSIDIADIIGRV